MLDARGELRELVQIGNLALDGGSYLWRQRLGWIVVPFFRGLVERLVVVFERLLDRQCVALSPQLRSEPLDDRLQRASDCERGRCEQLAQHEREERPLARG